MPLTTDPTVMPERYDRFIPPIIAVIALLIIIIFVILAFCFYCIKQKKSKQLQRGCDGGYTIEESFNIEETGARRSRNSIYGQFGNFFRNIPIRLSSRVSRSESITDSRPDSLIDVNTRQT